MQEAAWSGLLRRIPPDQHDSLVLMTTNGTEIILQRMIRIDVDFLVALGRLSGSTDQAKILVLPFSQLTYLSFTKKLSDDEIQTILGKLDAPVAFANPPQAPFTVPTETPPGRGQESAAPSTGPAAAGPISPSAATPLPVSAGEAQPAKPSPKGAATSKSLLLARLRQRLAEDISKQAR